MTRSRLTMANTMQSERNDEVNSGLPRAMACLLRCTHQPARESCCGKLLLFGFFGFTSS